MANHPIVYRKSGQFPADRLAWKGRVAIWRSEEGLCAKVRFNAAAPRCKLLLHLQQKVARPNVGIPDLGASRTGAVNATTLGLAPEFGNKRKGSIRETKAGG